MADDRELFSTVADIIHSLLATSPHMQYVVENVSFINIWVPVRLLKYLGSAVYGSLDRVGVV